MLLERIGQKYMDYLILTNNIDPFSVDNFTFFRMAFGASIAIILLTILALLITVLLIIVIINQIKIKKLLKKQTQETTKEI